VAREKFVERNFRSKSKVLIDRANTIIAEYQAQDYKITVRQLFYQFVARGFMHNEDKNYVAIKRMAKNGRQAGELDWSAFEDRSRDFHHWYHDDDPADAIASAANNYQEDLWVDQPYRPVVWVEKDAVVNLFDHVCEKYHVSYLAHRGDNSTTIMHEAGKLFEAAAKQGKVPIVLLMSDHDPTGIDIERDTAKRLKMFARRPIEVRRIGLTMDQVKQYDPPYDLVKEDDKRAAAYIKRFGKKCWEIDALTPDVIGTLVADSIEALIVKPKWKRALAKQEANRALLEQTAEKWPLVQKLITK
jgi:hypothetical protein